MTSFAWRAAAASALGVMIAVGCGGSTVVEPGSGGANATSTSTSSSTTISSSGVGGNGCSSDEDCEYGAEWCIDGQCGPCDNSGQLCDIACQWGWSTYERHGCSPCECAPPNACLTDKECPATSGGEQKCYAGNFCYSWCPPDDPSCCHGNTCSPPGCSLPNPTGCKVTGCPQGQQCTEGGCASSGCGCSGGDWACDDDCGGGTCQ